MCTNKKLGNVRKRESRNVESLNEGKCFLD